MFKDFTKQAANSKSTIKDYVDEMPCGLEEERRKKVEVYYLDGDVHTVRATSDEMDELLHRNTEWFLKKHELPVEGVFSVCGEDFAFRVR